MNIIAIIQARTGSSRLPNKVFYELGGKPLLWHVVNRLKISNRLTDIIIATTNKNQDDLIEFWAEENKISIFRGDENNVLSRYFHAAKKYKADIVVRITADDPFKDAEIMDSVIDMVIRENIDFGFNNNPPSFPEGLDIEVFTFKALEKAYENSTDAFEKEHVTQYFYRNSNLFLMKNFKYIENISHLRWTIDTLSDYEMAKEVYNNLYKPNRVFLISEILELLKRKPEIVLINSNVERSTMYK